MKTTDHAREQERIRRAYRRRVASGREERNYFGYEDAAHLCRVHDRLRRTRSMLRSAGVSNLGNVTVLDIGCGDGAMLRHYMQWGTRADHVAGVDLREEPLIQARSLLPAADIRQACATSLPWEDGRFDLVSQHTAFSSMLDPGMRRAAAQEMSRVLAPGGIILWYDTRRENPGNPDVRAVSAAELRDLFPGFSMQSQRITFLPHVARRFPAWLVTIAYPVLGRVPFWCSHILAVLAKPGNATRGSPRPSAR